jgi:hypothetical protein
MFGNRDPRRTPHQTVPADSAPDTESETTATDGGLVSNDNQPAHGESDEVAEEEEMGLVDRLEAFLQFIATRARPDDDDVEQAEKAFCETIREIQEEDGIPSMAIAAALYEVLLNIEAAKRA